MVASSIHYLLSVALAWIFGKKDQSKWQWGLWGVLPDIDSIIIALLFLFNRIFSISTDWMSNQWAVVLFAHRGLSHSLTLWVIGTIAMLIFKMQKKNIIIASSLWLTHLVLDYITAWKLFLFLPFNYKSTYVGLVEVFDPILTLLSVLLFTCIASLAIAKKEPKKPIIFAYLIYFILGVLASMAMGEFSWGVIIIPQVIFWICIFITIKSKEKQTFWNTIHSKCIKSLMVITIIYITTLCIIQCIFAAQTGTTVKQIEPLEEFAINSNAHTYEMLNNNIYTTGIISYNGIEQEITVPKYRFEGTQLSQQQIHEWEHAYSKDIHRNWINNPVWTFKRDQNNTIYANIRYAKSFLGARVTTGPQQGISVQLINGKLQSYGRDWFN